MNAREKAQELMAKVESALHADDLATVDAMLKHADFSSLSVREGVGLVRASSRARASLVHWVSALRRLSVELKRQAPDRHDSLLAGLKDQLPARCNVIDARLRTWKCPLEKGKCLWQHRQTGECCNLEQELTVVQFCDLTGADQVSEADVDEFRERLRTSVQL